MLVADKPLVSVVRNCGRAGQHMGSRWGQWVAVALVGVAMCSPAQTHAQINTQVVMDMVLVIGGSVPGTPAWENSEGHCFELDTSGQLTVTLQLAAERVSPSPAPVRFRLYTPRVGDSIDTTVTRALSTFQVPAVGYQCYSIQNENIVPTSASMAEIRDYEQSIRVRMVWRPQ
jgi:hypothetical protein